MGMGFSEAGLTEPSVRPVLGPDRAGLTADRVRPASHDRFSKLTAIDERTTGSYAKHKPEEQQDPRFLHGVRAHKSEEQQDFRVLYGPWSLGYSCGPMVLHYPRKGDKKGRKRNEWSRSLAYTCGPMVLSKGTPLSRAGPGDPSEEDLDRLPTSATCMNLLKLPPYRRTAPIYKCLCRVAINGSSLPIQKTRYEENTAEA
ncbi:hypothetical protein ACLOJK_026632 [Asimina triloba]